MHQLSGILKYAPRIRRITPDPGPADWRRMAMNEQLCADLKATKAVLHEKGRCTTDAYGPFGSVCLVVAAGEAVDLNSIRQMEVMDALIAQLPRHYHGLVSFNEDKTVTDADVFTLIDKALAEAGGLA